MARLSRSIPLVAVLLSSAAAVPGVLTVLPVAPAHAQEDESTPPPVAQPTYEQTDRKKIMSMKLPKTWKSLPDDSDAKAIAGFQGFYGDENQSPHGWTLFYVKSEYARAALARAMELREVGPVKPDSMEQGPGWTQGAALDEEHHQIEWRRYVEKGGRVYMFRVITLATDYDAIKAQVKTLLATATVPGDYAPPSLGEGWKEKKSGDFDIVTDADAERESSIKKATALLGDARQAVSKALPGKPFDASRPVAWIFRNGTKFDERAKAATGVEPKFAAFSPGDRCAMVSIIGESAMGHEEAVYMSGARQYISQYFGGEPPTWVTIGLGAFGQYSAMGGGKKISTDIVNKAKAAVAGGKRRLDQWFDLKSWNEVSDNDQGINELFAWHWYFKNGRGSKKYKKQYDGYITTLRDTGDPVAARKSFDGVNFDEMLTDFKAWAADWKP